MGRPMMPSPMTVIFCRAMVSPLVAVVMGDWIGGRCLSAANRSFGTGHGGLVLQPDKTVVAVGLAVEQQKLQGQFAAAGFATAGDVGDLDVAELGGVVAHDLCDVVTVDGQVEEVGEEGDV